ncbi:MAG: hypothetical protein IJ615_06550 [Bacteroidaceae bacterium]|nr:hypothetical protein [Bacteroidaceae bacterium]
MKRILVFFTLMVSAWALPAQDEVNFEFSDGIAGAALKSKMERQMCTLLTAINKAEREGRDINFTGIDIDQMASQSITALWANARFRCLDDDIVEHGIALKRGGRIAQYQVRNIAVEMKPVDASYTDDVNQEICVNFDLNGQICDFNIAMDIHQYTRLMKEGITLGDIDERQQIISFCEKFMNYYREKDLANLEAIFSDDALIITGKEILRRKPEIGMAQKEYEYTVQTKKQYLDNLRKIFTNPRTGAVSVKFSDYVVRRHGSKPNYYGVTLIQDWATNTYKDQGIVFLVWDFTDKEKPKIQVRTWQPMSTDKDEIFTLQRFKLH